MMRRQSSYEAFFDHYLREHKEPATRTVHIAATAAALGLLATAVATRRPALLLAALAVGYGPAWAAHAGIEHNRPATFSHPWWSLLSDLRMAWLWLAGRLEPRLRDAGVEPPGRSGWAPGR